MKKNVEIIKAEAPLLEWTVSALRQVSRKPSGADELIGGMAELLEGSCSALWIEGEKPQKQPAASRAICCEGLTIYPDSRRVVREGSEIFLTPKEFDILCFLAKNRGEVFTKEQIYEAVWDGAYLLDDSNIMAFIRKLRKKIEPNPDAPRYILTIWGIGYKFSDRIREPETE